MSGLIPVYAGIVVSDIAVSAAWYEQVLGCPVSEGGQDWVCLRFPDHSSIELFAGDPRHAGAVFPSYGGAHAAAVMPGYAVADPEEAVEGLPVARRLPDWYVVVAPDGLRVVLTTRDSDAPSRFVGFRFTSPIVDAQQRFLAALGVVDEVAAGDDLGAVPLIGADRTEMLSDPDGTFLQLMAVPPGGR